MRLREIMRPGVFTVSVGEPAERAWKLMREKRIRHLVVMSGPRIAGVLSERDLGGPNGRAVREGRTVVEVMTPHVVSAGPDTPLEEAAARMRERNLGCLPVVEGEALVGIVTASDLLQLVGNGRVAPRARRPRKSPG